MDRENQHIPTETEEQVIAVDEAQAESIERPETEEAINAEYEHLLRDNIPIDAGAEGLIYYLKVAEADPAFRKLMQPEEGEEQDGAVKVLKVFKPGQAKNEFEWQKKAYEAVNAAVRKESVDYAKYARVPKPIEFRTIKLSDETRQTLESQGAKLATGEAEVILMDYIEGQDLQEVFYRWIVAHAPEDKEYAKVDAETASFELLHRAVSGILDFKYSRGELTDEEVLERRKKVYSALKRTGFKMPAGIVDQIHNTRQLLHRNNIYHNDEHERNFMVSDGQVFMIDFSRASESLPKEEMGVSIENQLVDLSPEVKERESRQRETENASMIQRMAREINFRDRYPSVFVHADRGGVELQRHLINRALGTGTSESELDNFFALLVNLRDNQNITSEQAAQIADIMKHSLVKPVVKRGKQVGQTVINPAAQRRIESYKHLFS
jgi:hypothetical protein